MSGTRSALIIASETYTDAGLKQLRAPASDAQALATVLQDPAIGGFEVSTVLNKPAHAVSLAVEDFFADRHPDDLLLLHFSGHGVKDEDGELYFAAANTKLSRLAATAMAAGFVTRLMNRSRSQRIVLLLDCCYAGAFPRGMTVRSGRELGIQERFEGRGRAVITASDAMQYAFEGGELTDDTCELPPSVFTGAIVEGLRTGDADQDQDGLVTLDELYEYVFNRVRRQTPNQTPGKWALAAEGKLFIARRARPVTVPATLADDLQNAIRSPLAGVRTGAVQELAHLLLGRHAGLALAARQALEGLADDDSRRVAAAAAAALADGADRGQPGPAPGAQPPSAAPGSGTATAGQEAEPGEQGDEAAGGADKPPATAPGGLRKIRIPSAQELAKMGESSLRLQVPSPLWSAAELAEQLADRQSRLATLLATVEDEPRLMDANLDATHELVRNIRRLLQTQVFSSLGPLPGVSAPARRDADEARDLENGAFELYEADLAGYRNKTTALDAVLERRRAYIGALRVFERVLAGIIEYLSTQ